MPTEPKPGEVWFAELGMVEKSRSVQGLASFDPGKLARCLGTLAPEQHNAVKAALRDLLML